jgi:TfoX/Sxy family transcriptional regulator of competence genes
MVESFRADLAALISRSGLSSRDRGRIECRHFFSGAAAYADGKIFMSLSPAGLALKLPEDRCADLTAAGAGPLKYFAKSPIKKGYVVLPAAIAGDRSALLGLLKESLRFSSAA